MNSTKNMHMVYARAEKSKNFLLPEHLMSFGAKIIYLGVNRVSMLILSVWLCLANYLILLARLARLERATYGLEVRCSIQLSYRRV